MNKKFDKISEIFSRIAEFFGIKSSGNHYIRIEEKLVAAKADNEYRLGKIKEGIRKFEARALELKEEFKSATSNNTKQVVSKQIEQIFKELDQLQNREKIISSNINKVSISLTKLEEIKDAKIRGLEESDIDDITDETEDVFDELKATDKQSVDLDKIKYEPMESNHANNTAEKAEIENTKEQSVELSENIQKRFEEFKETEE